MCGLAAFLFGFDFFFPSPQTVPIIPSHSGHSSGNALTSSSLGGIVFLLYHVLLTGTGKRFSAAGWADVVWL